MLFCSIPAPEKRCQKCGTCVRTCKENAIFQAPGKYPIFISDFCSGCGACWTVCPNKAIKPKGEEIGQVYLNEIRNPKSEIPNKSQIPNPKFQTFWLVTGIAKAGLEETGPVVTKVKEFALNLAKRFKADYILFDTAAGTHCPVISALMDCDLAYAVTEPTPMGAYDLNLISNLCKKLKVKTKIILNQADLGDKRKVEKTARSFKMKVEKEIPYSKEIVQAYSKGQLLSTLLKYTN